MSALAMGSLSSTRCVNPRATQFVRCSPSVNLLSPLQVSLLEMHSVFTSSHGEGGVEAISVDVVDNRVTVHEMAFMENLPVVVCIDLNAGMRVGCFHSSTSFSPSLCAEA